MWRIISRNSASSTWTKTSCRISKTHRTCIWFDVFTTLLNADSTFKIRTTVTARITKKLHVRNIKFRIGLFYFKVQTYEQIFTSISKQYITWLEFNIVNDSKYKSVLPMEAEDSLTGEAPDLWVVVLGRGWGSTSRCNFAESWSSWSRPATTLLESEEHLRSATNPEKNLEQLLRFSTYTFILIIFFFNILWNIFIFQICDTWSYFICWL